MAWFDTSGDVHVIRNPATMSDAAIHRGTFSIGPDDCLYVTVVDDYGTVTYLAAVISTTVVTRESVSQDEATFPIGADAAFTQTELVGDVPPEALAACTGATKAYGALPASL